MEATVIAVAIVVITAVALLRHQRNEHLNVIGSYQQTADVLGEGKRRK